MRLFIIFFIMKVSLIGQFLPTIPNNVFRITIGTNNSSKIMSSDNNKFRLNGIGQTYFDNLTHNDSVRFSSNYDLYHNGTVYIDSISTIEEWMTDFNLENGFTLPVFGAQNIDTSQSMAPVGYFREDRIKKANKYFLNLEYGLTNEITLSASIPYINSYSIEQTFSEVSVGKVENSQLLLDYHTNSKQELKNFINSNSFSNLRRGLRDSVQMVYDMFYRNNGTYSLNWIFHAQDDPINNLLINEKFLPPGIGKDTVSISDLVSYYYPKKKNSSGFNDIKLGATFLLKGTPYWALDGTGDAIYGQFFLTIPYGQTLSQFLDVRRKQFSEAKIGSGISRWFFGIYGSKKIHSKNLRRAYAQCQVALSTIANLNTPVALFSGGHTHPDSILSLIGNNYKYEMGTGVMLVVGGEFENNKYKDRLRFKSEILVSYKENDNYISKNPSWDIWMEKYAGNTPYYSKADMILELWFLNSMSKNKIGPIPFDFHIGIESNIIANNIYSGWEMYAGISTYYQGW